MAGPPSDEESGAWLKAATALVDAHRDHHGELSAAQAVAAMVRRDHPELALCRAVAGPAFDPPPVDPGLRPWLLGALYESRLAGADRHRQGIHYTPPGVARRLVGEAMDELPSGAVVDPAVGGGVFLLAGGEVLARRGLPRRTIVTDLLWGVDLDEHALLVADAALTLWSALDGPPISPGAHLACGDTLTDGPEVFVDGPSEFVLVAGNPPFQNQLTSDTARSSEAGARLRQRWGVSAGAYVDTAVLFLVAALEFLGPGGRVVLVQPHSTLVATSAADIRERLLDHAPPVGLWVGGRGIFAAGVHVCAPILERGASADRVRRWRGSELEPAGAAVIDPAELAEARTWGPLAADLLGVPLVEVAPAGTVGDLCTATAGFRDQFYGLAGHVREAPPDAVVDRDRPSLVTAGMIDPLRNRWGTAEFRFSGRRYTQPVVNRASLAAADETLAGWVADRLEPKLLVATQTKVIEVIVDVDGVFVPSTPVIAVTPPPDRLWDVAAVLLSPVATAWALHRFGGAALTLDTVKLSAKQVLALPLPSDRAAWERAAGAARDATGARDAVAWNEALDRLGDAMQMAYGAHQNDVTGWWRDRRPAWR